MLRFIIAAWAAGRAYIDMDGTLLRRMRVPANFGTMFQANGIPYDQDALQWWHDNLCVTPIIKRRLPVLYFMRYVLGIELIVYTNRGSAHKAVTWQALGKHGERLFARSSFHIFDGGEKHTRLIHGPAMDDQQKYVDCGYPGGLLVKQL